MADQPEIANAGEQISTTPSALPLKPDEQFRLINQRLDTLSSDIEKIAKPPHFRVADVVTFIIMVLGLAVTGFGLSERISDINSHQADTERRQEFNMNAAETRLQSKLDKLSEQFSALDERTSRIEGEKSAPATKKP